MPKRVQPANQLTESQAAYLAGIIDGEGCITACINRGYINGGLEIGSVNKAFLEILQQIVGTVTLCEKGRRSKNAKILYVWHIQMGAMPSLLPQVLPHLILKKTQAKLMLSLATYSEFPTVIDKSDSFQIRVLHQFRSLNRRGELATSN